MSKTNGSSTDAQIDVGVIGVGSMGQHHARVYSELLNANLVGVTDVDWDQAESIAAKYGTSALELQELLGTVEAVSIAVPTEKHAELVQACIERDINVLVEKPFVLDVDQGRELSRNAKRAGITLQIGYIERFNPAVRVLSEMASDLDIIAVDIQRLGPPVERDVSDSVVYDLMVHDIDILLSVIDADIESLSAIGVDGRHVSSQIRFQDGSIGELTASRLTQQKVRKLALTAEDCRVVVDFISQTIEVHRQSLPAHVEYDDGMRYRHESVVERPMVKKGEPLKLELESFLDAIHTKTKPLVTPEDAIQVLEIAGRIENQATLPKPTP